jgi:hypothetical protein
MSEKEPREHGLIFGRGDELGEDVEEPPMAPGPMGIQIPGYNRSAVPFGDPPPEPVVLEGEIPWELKDEGT